MPVVESVSFSPESSLNSLFASREKTPPDEGTAQSASAKGVACATDQIAPLIHQRQHIVNGDDGTDLVGGEYQDIFSPGSGYARPGWR